MPELIGALDAEEPRAAPTTFGAPALQQRVPARTPGDVDDERFIAAWTEAALAVARRYGIDERD